MAKAKIIESKHGATLIFQKDPTIRGYKFAIAFRGGSQFDGMYPGLSHLIEHLIFRELSDEKTKVFFGKTLAKCTGLGAYTSQHSIVVYFNTSKEDAVPIVKSFMNRILNKTFTQEQILKEIDVISHEIELSDGDIIDEDISDDFMVNNLVANKQPKATHEDLLGSYKMLKKTITPQVISDYINQYFTESNLMVSIVSNEKFDDVVEFCNKNIFSKVSRTKSPDFVAPYPNKLYFYPKNVLALEPDDSSSGVVVNFYIRERIIESSDPEFELACDCLESNLMGKIGGVLWNAFRVDEPLAYVAKLNNIDVDTSKFKKFQINTNKAHLNKVIKKLCTILSDIAKNGFDKKMYENIQKTLLDANANKIFTKAHPSALNNFQDYLTGTHIVDETRLQYLITHMPYEEFFEHIRRIYSNGQISLRVTGDFDSRKCYNLVEIEEMLGNKAHSKEKYLLNVPRYEITHVPLSDQEQATWEQIVAENGISEGDDEFDPEGGILMKNISATLDSRDYLDKLVLPMVIRYRKVNDKMVYTGFVPGFEGKDVIDENLESCKAKLFEQTKTAVKEMLAKNKPFPFFPTKEELVADFDDIVSITFVNVPNTKK